MTLLLDWPEALEAAGVTVRLLDGWDTPALPGYYWREPNDEPAGMMHHHTATASYMPNRDKASAYAGLGRNSDGRLYQEDYGNGAMFPVFTIANAFPAPISSGYGVRRVLEDYVKRDIEFNGRPGSDDSNPRWAGNTHYVNIEWVLNGTGAPIDDRVWSMMVTVCDVTNDLYGWTPARHIGHGHHTGRKVDLWDGRDTDYDHTIQRLRDDMGDDMAFTHYKVGDDRPSWEEVLWFIYIIEGGTVDPNKWALDQIRTELPWRNDLTTVMVDDLDWIASFTGMSDTTRAKFLEGGLYRWGKELAAVRDRAVTV